MNLAISLLAVVMVQMSGVYNAVSPEIITNQVNRDLL